MKRYWVAAGTLLLSTSTIAWAQTDAKVDPASDKSVVASAKETTFDKSFDASAAGKTAIASSSWKDAGFDSARTESWSDWREQTAFGDAKADTASLNQAKADMASFNDAKVQTASWDDAKVRTASWDDSKAETDSWDEAKVRTAAFDGWEGAKSDTKLQTASLDKVEQTGMGGPLEETGTSLDLAPRAATENYPPCSPGPGDDRCIQLYEPGVRAQLAAWNEPTGGLADHSATTAMGGPYEPVDETDMAAVDDGADVKLASVESDTGLAAHSDYQGVGGPIESQSGYPPCSAGPGDDRCIQLYESGVTGAGN